MPDNLFNGIEPKGRNITYTNMEGSRVSGSAQTEYDRLDGKFPNGGDAGPSLTSEIGVTTQNPRSTGQAFRITTATSLPAAAGVPHFSIPFLTSVRAGATAITGASTGAIATVIPFSYQVPLCWSVKRDGAGTTSTWKVLTGRGDVTTAKTSTTDNAVTFPVDINDATQTDYLSDTTGFLGVTTAAAAVGGCRTWVMVSRLLMTT